MRRHLLAVLAAILLAPLTPMVLVAAPAQADAGPATTHPRLLFSADDVKDLRTRVSTPGSVHAAAWARLQERAEGHLLKVHPDLLRPGVCVPGEPILLHGNYNGLECAYNLQNEMPTYLIDLGMAYQLSGDARYGRRVIELISALGDAGFPYWSGQDLGIGDLLEGVGLGFDWTYELMTPQERRKIVDDVTAHQDLLFVRPLFEYTNEASTYPSSNWMGVTAGGAGLTLLAIKGEPGAPTTFTSPPQTGFSNVPAFPETTYTFDQYLDKAMLQVRTYFRGGIDMQGASHEGTTYANYGLKNSVPFALAARREGLGDAMDGTGLPATHSWGGSGTINLPLGNPGGGTGMRLLSRWLALEQLPGEGQNFVPLNDSQRMQVGVDLQSLLFAINPDDGVAQWVWRRTVGELGTDYYREPHVPEYLREDKCRDPQETSSFAACDLFNLHGNVWTILFYRSPDQTPEVDPATLGPLSVHHSERGLVDARTGFKEETGEVVSTFEARRNGIAHFQYDLGNFTLYGEGGRWAVDPGFDCVACKDDGISHLGGYADQHNVVVIDNNRRTQASSSRYHFGTTIDRFLDAPNLSLAHADLRYAYNSGSPYAGRDHFFSRVPGRPVILGITDHMQRDSSPHVYRWQMLTNNDNVVTLDGTGFRIQQGLDGATLSGRVAAGGSAAGDLSVKRRDQLITTPTDDNGKVFPVVYTETPPQLAMDQMAVMALTPAGAEPAVTETIRVIDGNAIGVTWQGVQDVVIRKIVGRTAVSGDIATDASIAKFTRDGGETVMRDGTRLSAFGRSYVTVVGGTATVAVSGDSVQAIGASTNSYRVLAPQEVRSVTVNGAAVRSCRDGQHLVFPCKIVTSLELAAPASAPGTDAVVLSATLLGEGTPLAGETVSFSVGELSASGVTDSSGVATVSLPLMLHAGTYSVQAVFAARGDLAGSSAEAALQVVPDETVLTYTGDTQATGETVQVSAVLSEDEGVGLAGMSVSFTIGQTTVTVTTDATGTASTTMTVPDHGRSQDVRVRFAGTARHAPSAANATVRWGSG